MIIVENGVSDRLLRLLVVRRQTLDVIAAKIEVAAVALPRQVQRRDRLAEVVRGDGGRRDRVVRQVELVRQHGEVPPELEIRVDGELAAAVDVAAEPAIGRAVWRGCERAGICFVDPGGPDVIEPVVGAPAELAGAEEALSGKHRRREGEIVVRRQVEEDRLRDPVAELRLVQRLGFEEAGFPGHVRVG